MKKITTMLVMLLVSAATLCAQWSSDPLQNLSVTNAGCQMKAKQAPNGNIFVSYLVSGENWSYILKLQLLDKNGQKLWGEDGIVVSDKPTRSSTVDYGLDVTADGCAVLIWDDCRDDAEDREVNKPYAYKIDQEQNFLWGEDGVEIPMSAGCHAGPSTVLGLGDSAVVGYEELSLEGIRSGVVKILDDGSFAWDNAVYIEGENIALCQTVESDFIMVWMTDTEIMAQRMDSYGAAVWTTAIESRAFDDFGGLCLSEDGNGGGIIAYRRYYDMMNAIPSVQHVSADGELQMGLQPVDAYGTETGNASTVSVLGVNAEESKLLVCWEMRLGDILLKASEMDFSGDYLWSEEGVTVESKNSPAGYGYSVDAAVAMDDGGWLVIFRDDKSWGQVQLVAKRLDREGKEVWSQLIGQQGDITEVVAFADEKQAYMFWGGSSTLDEGAIFGQNLFFDGSCGSAGAEAVMQNEAEIRYNGNANELQVLGVVGEGELSFYNLQGMLVGEADVAEGDIIAPAFPDGVYIVRLQADGIGISKKIVIRR